LGRPNGEVQLPDSIMYLYDRGNVRVSAQGVVIEVNLTPIAKYQAMKTATTQEFNDKLTTAQTNKRSANALLDLLLSDPAYQAKSTEDRMLALKQFDRDHPGSDAMQTYKDLMAIYQVELTVKMHEQDLENSTKLAQNQAATLQKRLDDDEKELTVLRQRVEQAEQQSIKASIQPKATSPVPEQLLIPNNPANNQPNTNGPVGKAGSGGVVITPGYGGSPFGQPAQPPANQPIMVNGTLQRPPSDGNYWVRQPDGTYKLVGSTAGQTQ